MELNNPLYKNQGIHAIASIFTVSNGKVKVLLIRRKKEPFKDEWILTGGAVYNNEEIIDGLRREILEKTGIKDINLYQFNTYSKLDRSPEMRMVAVAYVGLIDSNKVDLLKETRNTSDSDWFDIDMVPNLGFDHSLILKDARIELGKLILKTNILKNLFPDRVTIPELHKTYESILNKKFDRRNFRKKILTLNLLDETTKLNENATGRPAKLYKFKDVIEEKNVF